MSDVKLAKPYRWEMTKPGDPMVKVDFDPFPPGDGEVVVKVAGCGVCHTDLGYYYDGVRTTHDLPLALGHEISGHVVAVGPGAERWDGKAVIIPAVVPCGKCDLCLRGKETICRDQVMPGYDIQGGFGSHIKVPTVGLCEVDEVRLEKAGLTLADLSVIADAVTTPYQAVEQSGIGEGDLAIVIGAGGVGGYCVQMAAAFGATVIAIDVDQGKLDNISGHGPALTMNARDYEGRELKKAIGAFAKENGLRQTEWFIFECSGTSAGQASAYSLLVHGATLGVVGFTMDKVEVRLSNLMAFHARALGNWGCPPRHYPAVLELVLDGKVEVQNFVEHHPLDQINEIFEAVHAHKNKARPVLIPA
jgi:6-hydroxycyclohex-1-ene-1-carbonyl-CoA dehydrogenase